jgi:hypothetical protein
MDRRIAAGRRPETRRGPSRAPTPGTARILAQPQADRALDAYIKRRPRAWERFKPMLENTLGNPITETGTPLPIVELRRG